MEALSLEMIAMKSLLHLPANSRHLVTRTDSGRRRALLFATLLALLGTSAFAQQLTKVSQSAWLVLTQAERAAIQGKYIVELAEQDSFGIIIDNQGVNESTAGTTAGANLGGAVANAAYIDNAIKSGNYSAKNQLAVGILGAVLGSALDSQPTTQFHFRYAVKLGNGNIQYFDEVKTDAFRHPVGVCVSVPRIALIDQQLCSQTAASLRLAYLGIPLQPTENAPAITAINSKALETLPNATGVSVLSPTLVNCKLGTLAPVKTSAEKCELIKGSQVP